MPRLYLRATNSVDLEQFDIEDKVGIGGDGLTSTTGAIAHLGGDVQGGTLAQRHQDHALVPALDHLCCVLCDV